MSDKNVAKKWSEIEALVIRGAAALLGFAALILGGWAIFNASSQVASALFVVGFLLLLYCNFDKIEFFKGFGIETKIRKIDEKIIEAEEIIENLRELAELSGAMIMRLSAGAGRAGYHNSIFSLEKLRNEVVSLLDNVGARSEKIVEAQEPFKNLATGIVYGYAADCIQELLNKRIYKVSARLGEAGIHDVDIVHKDQDFIYFSALLQRLNQEWSGVELNDRANNLDFYILECAKVDAELGAEMRQAIDQSIQEIRSILTTGNILSRDFIATLAGR